MIGQTVSHYKILEKLGGGGMGVVYKAEDTRLKRTVALKFLPPSLTLDPDAKVRFSHEAQAASALDHPNICTIHDVGQTEDGQMYLVMACYEGKTLKEKIEREGPLDIDLALDIAIQVAEGLARAHESGIVHRDIKSANIFVTSRNEVKILDFGLAKLAGQSMLTKTGSTLGTVAYMSPEQACGEAVDHRTDLWSLGVVLYEMLKGIRPFENDYEQALIYAILNQHPTLIREGRPEVPEVVDLILSRALAKKREERYQTAAELRSDLRIARGSGETGGTIATAEAAKIRRKKKMTRRLLVAGLAAVLLAGGAFVALPLLQDHALASNPRSLAFVSLDNRTGDKSLEYLRTVLPDVLGKSLEDSKYLRVTPPDRVRELMKLVGKGSVEFIDKETGLLLCKRAKIDMLCAGSYTKAGPLFLTEIELIDVNTGNRLGSPIKARGREVESFLKEEGVVDDLAGQIARRMGVSQLSAQLTLKPVADVSSGSIEAQRYYQRGKKEVDNFNLRDARRYLEQAVKEDSTFAIAWFYLGVACRFLGESRVAGAAMDQAVRNASRATEKEQFLIAGVDSSLKANLLKSKGRSNTGGDLLSWVKARAEIFPFDARFRRDYAITLSQLGRVSQAIEELETVVKLDQASGRDWNELGYNYVFAGEFEKGMQALERSAELDPGEPNPLQSMAECLLIQGKFDEGVTKCEAALQVKPDFWGAGRTLARLYFMKEEYGKAITWAERASELAPSPVGRAYCLWWRAWYLLWSGRLKEAEETLHAVEQKSLSEYQKNNITESHKIDILGGISWLRAWCAYEGGDWRKARRHLLEVPEQMHLQEQSYWPWLVQFCLGLVDLQEGKLDSIGTRMERIRPALLESIVRDTVNSKRNEEIGRSFRNALQNAYMLAAGRPEEIQPSWTRRTSHRIQNPDSLTTANWPIFVPVLSEPTDIEWIPIPFDILPRAYVERGMIDSAIASYELALKKPLHFLGPIVPRYYYRLGRLYEQNGMKEKAIENYAQFLKVWGKADPIYKEPADARKRLARLKNTKQGSGTGVQVLPIRRN